MPAGCERRAHRRRLRDLPVRVHGRAGHDLCDKGKRDRMIKRKWTEKRRSEIFMNLSGFVRCPGPDFPRSGAPDPWNENRSQPAQGNRNLERFLDSSEHETLLRCTVRGYLRRLQLIANDESNEFQTTGPTGARQVLRTS